MLDKERPYGSSLEDKLIWVNWPSVEVHEQFHFNQAKSRYKDGFVRYLNDTFKSTYKVSMSEYSKDAALNKFRGYSFATSNLNSDFDRFNSPFVQQEDGLLMRRGSAYDASRAVTRPIAVAICEKARRLGWTLDNGNTCSLCDGL